MELRIIAGCGLLALSGLVLVGCSPAGRYWVTTAKVSSSPTTKEGDKPDAKAKDKDKDKEKEPLSPDIAWERETPSFKEPEIPIRFVHQASSPEEWAKLKEFWNGPKETPQGASLVGFPLLSTPAALLAMKEPVLIKVPLGLDDPNAYIPASNPPTLGKWELGKQLFFDETYLDPGFPGFGVSCAKCHMPNKGFQDGLPHARRDTPTLINVIYNAHQYWDGRGVALEEVVQTKLEDEREDPTAPLRFHVWSGVIERLRKNKNYTEKFKKVFGTRPTQDAVGKALATYMRTILVGDSLQDRAEQALRDRKGAALEAQDYEKVLTDAYMKALERDAAKKPETAKELLSGYTLFRTTGRCTACHTGRNYTDATGASHGGFHNIGVGDSNLESPPGREPGRFAHLPPGLKDRRMIGAYKTPTLRALPRTAPYFHDGRADGKDALFDAVMMHVKKDAPMNPYLDRELRDEKDETKRRDFGLKDEDVKAIVLFLKALDGEALPSVLETKVEKKP